MQSIWLILKKCRKWQSLWKFYHRFERAQTSYLWFYKHATHVSNFVFQQNVTPIQQNFDAFSALIMVQIVIKVVTSHSIPIQSSADKNVLHEVQFYLVKQSILINILKSTIYSNAFITTLVCL